MIKTKRMGYQLSLIGIVSLFGIAALIGSSQAGSSEYVPPSETGPRGKAPRMQVQLLSEGEQAKQYAVIFGKGDEAFSGLQDFAEKYHVTSAHFTALNSAQPVGARVTAPLWASQRTRRRLLKTDRA